MPTDPESPVDVDPTRMYELLVGLPAMNVLGIGDDNVDAVVVYIESRLSKPACPSCGTPAWVKDRPPVELVACRASVARRGWCGTSTVGAAPTATARWVRGRATTRGSRRRVER
jgi:hypothetical protein